MDEASSGNPFEVKAVVSDYTAASTGGQNDDLVFPDSVQVSYFIYF